MSLVALAVAADLAASAIGVSAEEFPKPIVSADLVDLKATGQRAVRVKIVPPDGWHVYWTNPGDGGQATKITLSTPDGKDLAPAIFPAPSVFQSYGERFYGYGRAFSAYVPVPASPSSTSVSGTVDYLLCGRVCVPGQAVFNAGQKGIVPAVLDPALPKALAASGLYKVSSGRILMSFPRQGALNAFGGRGAQFYPDQAGWFSSQRTPRVREDADRIYLDVPSGPEVPAKSNFSGVLVAGDGQSFHLVFRPGSPAEPQPWLLRLILQAPFTAAAAFMSLVLFGLILRSRRKKLVEKLATGRSAVADRGDRSLRDNTHAA